MARKKGASRQTQGDRPKRKKGGKRTGLLKILAVAVITAVVGLALLSVYGPRIFPGILKTRISRPRIKPPAIKESRYISVYFSNEDGTYLRAETRSIDRGTIETEAAEAIRTLIEGPGDRDLGATVPIGASLLSLKVEGSTAYADFSAELVDRHPGGSSGEIQTVYSIVNTLTFNFPAIKEVQILVEGKAVKTLAGHIDVTAPLGPDMAVVRD
jgi:spore germination protein GerM